MSLGESIALTRRCGSPTSQLDVGHRRGATSVRGILGGGSSGSPFGGEWYGDNIYDVLGMFVKGSSDHNNFRMPRKFHEGSVDH